MVGNEGSMIVEWDKVTLTTNKSYAAADDPLLKTKLNGSNIAGYDRKKMLPPDSIIYKAEEGYKGAHFDHFYNFFQDIRNGAASREDALFGYRAAAPALLCNDSYFKQTTMRWNPEQLTVVS